MENRRGNGIFLGVVSVATLIVAIIGATFAYFSASTESDPNAVELTAYEFRLSLSMSQIYPENGSTTSGIIPLDADFEIPNATAPNNTNLLYALNVAKNKCIDDNGLQVCALYQVTINNQATNPVTLTGSIKTTGNTPAEGDEKTGFMNLTYQSVIGSHTDNTLSKNPEFEAPVTLPTEIDQSVSIANIVIPGATTGDDGELVPGTGTSYVLIYLDDNDDQSAEMGAQYSGQVIYSSGGTGNTLTGTFTVGGTTEENPEEPTE